MANQQSLNSLLQWGIEHSTPSTTTTTTNATATGITNPSTDPSSHSSQTSSSTTQQQQQATTRDPSRGLNASALAALLGGPSDADLMRESMHAITASLADVSHDDKQIAWDNFEQLIEQIDNANNLEPMGLWPPLLAQLHISSSSPDTTSSSTIAPTSTDALPAPSFTAAQAAAHRSMAAWCVSTAVQNNIKAQERLLSHGGIAKLASLATSDVDPLVRKKAISALSSEVRNYQPALDELVNDLPTSVWNGAEEATTAGTALDAADMDAVDELMNALRAAGNNNHR